MAELPPDVRALAEGPNHAHVATLMPDGAPHSVPVWITEEDGRLAFLTGPGSRKARNLDRDPRVAISITAHDNPFTMAAIRGRATERLEGEPAWQLVDRMSVKYTGRPYPREEERVVYLVDVEHSTTMKFG
ncbi:PPOX class F420-dependent oxidoreductase [Nonomuraea sp. NPDC049152]|uniref:PPOX class F420-dependent oxidoreductase n=1 Tax=Nonomuraea sp. NPDC049152 TaxID=3154350 RepID=UPI0033D6EC46